MKNFFKFAIPALFAGTVIAIAAHAQVVPPNYFRKVGSNLYAYPNTASTTLGTSTEPGAFSNLTVSGTCTGCGSGGGGGGTGGASTSTSNTFVGPQNKFSGNGSGSGSQSTGGMVNITGTNSTSSAFVIYDNQTNEAVGQAVQTTCDTGFNTFDCFVIRGIASGTTALDVQGDSVGNGVIKCEHNIDAKSEDDTNASCLSIALNGTSTAAQGIFMDSASGTTGYDLQIRDKGNTVFSLQPESTGLVTNVAATFNATTTIQNLNTTYNIPSNYATAGCFNSAGTTDLGDCVNLAYSLIGNNGNYGVINIPALPSSTPYATGMAINTPGVYADLECSPGQILLYAPSSPTSTPAVQWGEGTGSPNANVHIPHVGGENVFSKGQLLRFQMQPQQEYISKTMPILR